MKENKPNVFHIAPRNSKNYNKGQPVGDYKKRRTKNGSMINQNFLTKYLKKGCMVEIEDTNNTNTVTKLADFNQTQLLLENTDGTIGIVLLSQVVRIDPMDEKGNGIKVVE
jgi:hypothetical protein